MSATAEEVRDILKSIDAGIKLLVAHLGAGARPHGAEAAAPGTDQQVASDRDLDSEWGDPEIKAKDPRDWSGDVMMGRHFSECPPEYSNMVAERLDYFNEKAREDLADATDNDEIAAIKKKMKYNTKDAGRARGWAKRLRAGWQPPVEEPIETPPGAEAPLTDDDIPF